MIKYQNIVIVLLGMPGQGRSQTFIWGRVVMYRGRYFKIKTFFFLFWKPLGGRGHDPHPPHPPGTALVPGRQAKRLKSFKAQSCVSLFVYPMRRTDLILDLLAPDLSVEKFIIIQRISFFALFTETANSRTESWKRFTFPYKLFNIKVQVF